MRDLEGVVNSLLAFSLTKSGEIDCELAERVCRQINPEKSVKFDVAVIMRAVGSHYAIGVPDMVGKSRRSDVVHARQVAIYLCHHLAHVPTTQIGRHFGGRDHSTVKHSIDKVVDRLEKDKAFALDVKAIERKIKENR